MKNECPKCGGITGYSYKITVEYIQCENWMGDAISAEQSGDGTASKILKCLDCGNKMSFKQLRGF